MSVDQQLALEFKYSKHQIKYAIKDEIEAHKETFQLYNKLFLRIKAYILKSDTYYASKQKRVSQLAKYDVATIVNELIFSILSIKGESEPIQSTATSLGFNFYSNQLDAVKTGAELLAICKDIGLYEIISYKQSEHDLTSIKPLYELSKTTRDTIYEYIYQPPMKCTPRPWKSNYEGGLLTTDSNCILGNGNAHDMTQSLDVSNKLQSIPWKFTEIVDMEEQTASSLTFHEWKDTLSETEQLLPSKRLQQKYSQLRQQVNQSQIIYDQYKTDPFYFIWKYDKRGRAYSQGYDINLQGSEFKKASIQFANEEILTGV